MIDHWRSKRHVTLQSLDDLAEMPSPIVTHDAAIKSVMVSRVHHAVNRLSDKQAQTIYLRMEGYDYGEIGDMLSASEDAAKQLGTRAFANLRTTLLDTRSLLEDAA